ncbi:MAG: hypothetical protein KGK08_11065 [Acidobacteriota bacterium]|nr:hypothetical protein [Acidobacteriota bacterium]
MSTAEEFRQRPAEGLRGPLLALWWDAQGDWERAHLVAQEEVAHKEESRDRAWVHAYLHRKEGDLANAAYWYRQAGRAVARGPLQDEWAAIVTELLQRR